jgi:hypothetical protein
MCNGRHKQRSGHETHSSPPKNIQRKYLDTFAPEYDPTTKRDPSGAVQHHKPLIYYENKIRIIVSFNHCIHKVGFTKNSRSSVTAAGDIYVNYEHFKSYSWVKNKCRE